MEHEHKNLRHELKYFISSLDYVALKNTLRPVLSKDRFSDDNNEYHIRSLYFDDIYNSALFEKQSGVERRKKFRIRIYNMSDKIVRMEKKSKFGQLTKKESAVILRRDVENILSGNVGYLLSSDNGVLREFSLEYKNNLLRPMVIVDYVREAYVHKLGNVRITFDKYLKTCLNSVDIFNKSIPAVSVLENPLMILEVKYDNFLPSYIKNLIQTSMHQRVSLSKYAMCRKFNKTNNWEDN